MNELTENQLLSQLNAQAIEMSNLIRSYKRADSLEVKQYVAARMMTRSTQFNVRAGHLGTGVAERARMVKEA